MGQATKRSQTFASPPEPLSQTRQFSLCPGHAPKGRADAPNGNHRQRTDH